MLALLLALLTLPACGAPERQPVRALESVRPEGLSAICDAGGSTVLVCQADYEAMQTTVWLVDAERDTVRRETVLEGVWDVKEQSFADGRFALCQRETNTWLFLDKHLQETGRMAAGDADGFFSYDGGSYYFLQDHVLMRTDVDGGQTERVPLETDLRFLWIVAYDAPSGQMALQFFLSPYGTECGTALLDVTTGQVAMAQQVRYQAAFTDGGICLMHFNDEAMGYSALYGSGDTFRFADAALFSESAGDLYGIPGSSYLMGVETGRSVLYAAGDTLESCALPDNGISGEMYTCCWLRQAQLLVGAVYQEGAFRLYALDPAQLTFRPVAETQAVPSPLEVDEMAVRAYQNALTGLPVAENMREVRQYADVLEQRYGVRILLSGQCREAAELSDRAITLSDTMDPDAEVEGTRQMLEAMARSFALYPEGFLAQFRNGAGEGGLCFLLVAHIDSDYGVVGLTYEGSDWQYIALDAASVYAPDGIICHEIWHAAENEILSEDFTAFNWDDWMALNPEGFQYYGDATMQDPDQPWTLYVSPIEDVYFVDSYSCVAATEDRARIMEFFMTHEDDAAQLIRSPHIRQKLQWMCSAVRAHFDTGGWENVCWERLLG